MTGPTADGVKRSLTNVRPSESVIRDIEELRAEAKEMVDVIFDHVAECPERTIALRYLEECVMWAVKAMCLHDPQAREIPIGEA